MASECLTHWTTWAGPNGRPKMHNCRLLYFCCIASTSIHQAVTRKHIILLLPLINVVNCKVTNQSITSTKQLNNDHLANGTHKNRCWRFYTVWMINSPAFRTFQYITRAMTFKAIPIMVAFNLPQKHKDILATTKCRKNG